MKERTIFKERDTKKWRAWEESPARARASLPGLRRRPRRLPRPSMAAAPR